MTKQQEQLRHARQILAKWEESIECMSGGTDRDRDSAILRFELAFEVIWKYIQQLVRENGLESNGPRHAFENAFKLGWIEDEVLFDEILKSRNTAVHVYREELARQLAARLPEYYRGLRDLVETATREQ